MSSTRILQVIIGAEPPARLDKALSRDVPEAEALSRSRLARIIAAGGVSRGGEVLDSARARVREGDVLSLTVTEQVETDLTPEAIPLDIRFEDADLIVINKPAGMVVHPAPGSPNGTLVNALMAHCGENLSGIGGERRPGIVHRIDKETSGLLVVAKSDRAHHSLAKQFEAHTVDRHYLALVYGLPDPGDPRMRGLRGVSVETGGVIRVETLIGRHRTDRQKQAVLKSGGRRAVTRFRIARPLGKIPAAALVDCWLETGRTHQIRVHLSYAGHSLIGDPVYGGHRKLPSRSVGDKAQAAASAFARQALHATTLGFTHPITSQRLHFESDLPSDMIELMAALGG